MPVLHCVTGQQFEKYDFLKQFDVKGPNETRPCSHGLGVTLGDGLHDGVVVLSDGDKYESNHIITDDGRVYKDLSDTDVHRFHLGTLDKKPTLFLSKEEARSFIADVVGVNELSKDSRAQFCSKNAEKCGKEPTDNPFYLSSRGRYREAEMLFDEKLTSSRPFQMLDEFVLNNYAWMIATAKDQAFREKNIQKAIRLAKKAIEIRKEQYENSNMDERTKKCLLGDVRHTLSMAYYASGDHKKALVAIGGYDSPLINALREMILKIYIVLPF